MKISAPLAMVFWEVTTACNLECVHCRRLEVAQELSREDLSLKEIYHFIEGLADDFDPPPCMSSNECGPKLENS